MRSRFSCSIVIGTVLLCVHVRGWQGEMDSLNSTKVLAAARMKDHADAAERSGQLAAFPSGWGHLWRGRQDLQAQLKEAAIRTNTYREARLTLVARDAPWLSQAASARTLMQYKRHKCGEADVHGH